MKQLCSENGLVNLSTSIKTRIFFFQTKRFFLHQYLILCRKIIAIYYYGKAIKSGAK